MKTETRFSFRLIFFLFLDFYFVGLICLKKCSIRESKSLVRKIFFERGRGREIGEMILVICIPVIARVSCWVTRGRKGAEKGVEGGWLPHVF